MLEYLKSETQVHGSTCCYIFIFMYVSDSEVYFHVYGASLFWFHDVGVYFLLQLLDQLCLYAR